MLFRSRDDFLSRALPPAMTSRFPAGRTAVATLLLLLLASACSKRGSEVRWLMDTDLIEHFPHATVKTETRAIDFGTLEARRYLNAGWSQDQLALAIEANGSRISRLERGLDALRTSEAVAIANVAGLSVAEIIETHESFRRVQRALLEIGRAHV